MDKQIKYIADYYGINHQLLKLSEEMSEVNIEITRLLNSKKDKDIIEIYKNKLPSELADISIMLDQVIYLLDCKEKVETERRYKVLRQLERIREVQNE